jgi:endonuclease IV
MTIPKILETPWWNDKPLYQQEIQLLKERHWKEYRK